MRLADSERHELRRQTRQALSLWKDEAHTKTVLCLRGGCVYECVCVSWGAEMGGGRAYPEHEIQTKISDQFLTSQNKDWPAKPAAYMITNYIRNRSIILKCKKSLWEEHKTLVQQQTASFPFSAGKNTSCSRFSLVLMLQRKVKKTTQDRDVLKFHLPSKNAFFPSIVGSITTEVWRQL